MSSPRLPIACLVAAAGALVPPAAVAQGRTAAPLLDMPVSARAAAMGDVFGPGRLPAADPAILFHNPSQLAGLPSTAATLSVERYLASSTAGAVAVSTRVGWATIGAGVLALDYPDAAEVVPDAGGSTGTETGARISAHDLVAAVAMAAGTSRARGGVLLEHVSQSLPGARGGAPAVGVGGSLTLARGRLGVVQAAAALQHVGRDLEVGAVSAPLPRTWRAGVTVTDYPLAGAVWEVTTELAAVRDLPASPRMGVEGTWYVGPHALSARAGWREHPDGALAQPLTLGAGLGSGRGRHRLRLDYAWRRFGALGATHRLGVRWHR